jgi:hypothetical protein
MTAPANDYPITLKPWLLYGANAAEYPIYDHLADGTAFDLTSLGATWRCEIKRYPDGPVAAEVTVDDTRADGSGGAGVPQLVLRLADTDIAGFSKRATGTPDYYCDVLVTGGTRTPLTVYALDVFFTENITDPA